MSFVQRYAEQGWLRIDGIFDLALIDALRVEFERQLPVLKAQEDGHRGYINVGDGRIMLSVKLTGPFLDPRAYANPMLMAILRQLLGNDLLIDNFTVVLAAPGAAEQRLHRDHEDLFPDAPALNAQLPPHAITAVVPLVDLTPETGTTKLYPGTHRGEDRAKIELPYIPRGSCFLMDYRLRHRGTENRSAADRPVLYVVYSRPWFIDVTNLTRQGRINIDRDDAVRLPPEDRPLFRRLAAKGAFDISEKELFGSKSDSRDRYAS